MKISIIGCGWLGLPLGKRLVEEGHQVMGSTTRQEKFETIEAAGITAVLMKLQPMPMGVEFNRLFDCDCLVINIPPGRKKQKPSHYKEQIKYLKYLCDQHHVPKVIFVSSTSYYPNTNAEVNEDTEPDLLNGSSQAVVYGENQIREIKSDLTILRCGGLMGGDRIPGKWFAGKDTPGANTPVNYVHRDDVIGIVIEELRIASVELRVLNLVAPEHPSRREVHEVMAKKHGFEKPVWVDPETIPHKVVTSKVSEVLDYEFLFPDPMLF